MSKRITTYNQNIVKTIVAMLDNSAIVGIPTETVYGLMCKFNDQEAIDRIYKIKSRDNAKPLSILVYCLEQAENYGILDDTAKKLAEAFWPGPLTLVVPSKINSLETIGIRVAKSQFIEEVLQMLGGAIIATSLNFANEKTAVTYEDIPQFFIENVDAFFDIYDSKPLGISSTVVKVCNNNFQILRQGAINESEIYKLVNL